MDNEKIKLPSGKSDRIVIRSNNDQHVLFQVFRSIYPQHWSGYKEIFDHHHPDIEISGIVSGRGTYYCEGVEYSFQAGDVFLHCVNDQHCFHKIDPAQQLIMVVFRFDQRMIWSQGRDWTENEYMQLFMENSGIGHHILHTAKEAQTICTLLQESFDECMNQEHAYEMIVKAKLLTILANLVRYFYNDLPKITLKVNPKHKLAVEKSMEYITRNLDLDITLDSLAEAAHMSRSYYSTIFKKLNGVSVWDYITNQRIDKAEQMLETTDIPVIEISENCGFNNISNFNRAFRKITGGTPRDYRKSFILREEKDNAH